MSYYLGGKCKMKKCIKIGNKVKAKNYKGGKYETETLTVSGEKIKKKGNFVVSVTRENGETLEIPTDFLKII